MTRTRSPGSSTVRSTRALSPARNSTVLVRVIFVYPLGSQVTAKVYRCLPGGSEAVSTVRDTPAPGTGEPLTTSSALSAGTSTTTEVVGKRSTAGAVWTAPGWEASGVANVHPIVAARLRVARNRARM